MWNHADGCADRLSVESRSRMVGYLAFRIRRSLAQAGSRVLHSRPRPSILKSLVRARSNGARFGRNLCLQALIGLISLGGGLPSSENFPFERLDLKVPMPPHFSEGETKESGVISTTGKYDVREGKSLYGMCRGVEGLLPGSEEADDLAMEKISPLRSTMDRQWGQGSFCALLPNIPRYKRYFVVAFE